MRGSYGNNTFVRYAKKNIVRAKPLNIKDAKTKKQLRHRQKFRLLVNIYQTVGDIIDTGFLQLKNGMTSYNMYISNNIKTAFDKTSEEPIIDYSRLLVSKGLIPRMNVLESRVGDEGIIINYETSIGLPKVSATDELTAFARLKNDDFVITTQTRGCEETCSMVMEYPGLNREDVVFCYLFARSADGKMSSNSVYVKVNPVNPSLIQI
jgi:hypothetical protein